MTVLKKAIIKSYDPAVHKAAVQIVGSLAVWLEAVTVATDIPAAEIQAGRECSVLLFEPDNPDSAVIVTVHGAVPSGAPDPGNHPMLGPKHTDSLAASVVHGDLMSGQGATPTWQRLALGASGRYLRSDGTDLLWSTIEGADLPAISRIEDADADTSVNTEQAADEDKVRIKIAAVERLLIQTASPHLNISGRSRLGERAAVNTDPVEGSLLKVLGTGSLAQGLNLIEATASSLTLTGNNRTFVGISGNPFVAFQAATTGHIVSGLQLLPNPGLGDAATSVSEVNGIRITVGHAFFSGSVTTMRGIYIKSPTHVLNTGPVATVIGLDIEDQGPFPHYSDAYGIRIADFSANSGLKRLIEAGPATPYLRLVGGATPGANLTNLYLNENGTLRRVQWKAGNAVTASDRVMVLV